ncbi:MAG: methionine gamma-lyase family protein [Clostridia bacterium]|nr:methionine gamma-lyase family protein [Clostridia bacterium]
MHLSYELYENFGISKKVVDLSEEIIVSLKDRFSDIDKVAELNQMKVLGAMQKNRVSAACFAGTTGYGHDDLGRDTLEKVYADVFHTDAALVRGQITCGTHALAVALMANLLPGDEMLCPAGKPYDTLEEVIGIRDCPGSLKEYGVTYSQVDLLPDNSFDFDGISAAINDKTKLVEIQRSKGYEMRPTFSVAQIGELIKFIKGIKPDVIVMVDNCYGEFVETLEPSDVGADLTVGSLIKNPGGGLAPIGGYICGNKELIERCAYRLTAPGIGSDVGASLMLNTQLYQGLFLAPTVVAAAVKGAVFAAALYERLGFNVIPKSDEPRYDIIQSVELGTKEKLVAFCRGIQSSAPVDSFATPVPAPLPGYGDDVIMAAGAFVQGSSIELSADGPMRPPYAVYFQGGLTFPHIKLGIMKSLQELLNDNLTEI